MVDQQPNHSRFRASQRGSLGASQGKALALTENQRITAMCAAGLEAPATNAEPLTGQAPDIGAYLETRTTRIGPQGKPSIGAGNAFRINSLKGSPTKAFSIAKSTGHSRKVSVVVSTIVFNQISCSRQTRRF